MLIYSDTNAANRITRLRFAAVVDGLSQTIFLGEKHVPLDLYGMTAGGDSSMYNADYADGTRVLGPDHPIARSPAEAFNWQFGSSHPGTCQFLFGDGAVRGLPATTPPGTLEALATRAGGEAAVIPD
jgi:prepilin-type processing-associated H-X9-DG protein